MGLLLGQLPQSLKVSTNIYDELVPTLNFQNRLEVGLGFCFRLDVLSGS